MHQMKLLERNVDLMEEADSWSCVSAGSSNKLTAISVDDCNIYLGCWKTRNAQERNGTERKGTGSN